MWHADLAAITEEGGCFTLTSHPFLTGRPARVRVLDRLIDRMQQTPGLWVATAGEVAAHVRGLGLRPRVFPQPSLPE
jgi:hypothetical protein